METKVCRICNIGKNVFEFHKRGDSKNGLRNECKECTRLKINNYRQNNNEKVNEWNRGTYYRNIVKHKETKKKYRDNNKESQKIRGKNYRDNNQEKIKKYYYDNKEVLSKKALSRFKNRKKTDKLFSVICSIRARFYGFLKSNNITKKNKTFDIVGCKPEDLRGFLEEKFVDGMSWENYGRNGWHVDHIIPLSSAKTEEEIYKLCHYTNLQPLWEVDNIKKGNKII
jgi:hypothetical protein